MPATEAAQRGPAERFVIMVNQKKLPPGQFELKDFPRFGLTQLAVKFPRETRQARLLIGGDLPAAVTVADELQSLPRVEQIADLHCVATWSACSLRWSGFRFADFYRQFVLPLAQAPAAANFVVFRCQDGYRVSLPLEDLLDDSVLLADRLNGEPLAVKHGAPLRLVAPAHYGYKNAKHLKGIEFWRDARNYRFPALRLMDHPRARVAYEERARGLPGWLLRYFYRLSIWPTRQIFQLTLDRHLAGERRRAEQGGPRDR